VCAAGPNRLTDDDVQQIVHEELEAVFPQPELSVWRTATEMAVCSVYTPASKGCAPLLPNQSVAVVDAAPKTAALCFDRVYDFFAEDTPPDIRCGRVSPDEVRMWARVTGAEGMAERTAYGPPATPDPTIQKRTALHDLLVSALLKNPGDDRRITEMVEPAGKFFMRRMADLFAQDHARLALPVFASSAARDRQFRPGTEDIVTVSLVNLGVADEQKLTWGQVRDFRKDEDAKRDYRRLVNWLDDEMEGLPVDYIQHELSCRLEAYEKALHKHGIARRTGETIATLLIRAGKLFARARENGAGPWIGWVGDGLILAGSATATFVEGCLDAEEAADRRYPGLALVHKVKALQEEK